MCIMNYRLWVLIIRWTDMNYMCTYGFLLSVIKKNNKIENYHLGGGDLIRMRLLLTNDPLFINSLLSCARLMKIVIELIEKE